MNDARRPAGGSRSKIVLLHHQGALARAGALPRDRNTIDATADHDDLEALAFQPSPGWDGEVHISRGMRPSKHTTPHPSTLIVSLRAGVFEKITTVHGVIARITVTLPGTREARVSRPSTRRENKAYGATTGESRENGQLQPGERETLIMLLPLPPLHHSFTVVSP